MVAAVNAAADGHSRRPRSEIACRVCKAWVPVDEFEAVRDRAGRVIKQVHTPCGTPRMNR